jgi:hypothetical protein
VLMVLTECNGMLVPQCCQSERFVFHRSFAWEPTNRTPPVSRPVGQGMFDDGSSICLETRIPVCCISTETAMPSENTTVFPINAKPMLPSEDSAAESPQRRMIRAYGDTSQGPPGATRKRGNPNWGRALPPAPALAIEFELRVRHLQLTPEMYTSSIELRTWCEHNRNRCRNGYSRSGVSP